MQDAGPFHVSRSGTKFELQAKSSVVRRCNLQHEQLGYASSVLAFENSRLMASTECEFCKRYPESLVSKSKGFSIRQGFVAETASTTEHA